jgi:hypothetical protein
LRIVPARLIRNLFDRFTGDFKTADKRAFQSLIIEESFFCQPARVSLKITGFIQNVPQIITN